MNSLPGDLLNAVLAMNQNTFLYTVVPFLLAIVHFLYYLFAASNALHEILFDHQRFRTFVVLCVALTSVTAFVVDVT